VPRRPGVASAPMPKRRWGSGEIVPPAGPGGTWAIRWREGGRKRRESGFRAQADARRALDKKRGDLAMLRAGVPLDPRGLPTLGSLAIEWLARREHTHPASHRHERLRWEQHLSPAFGSLRAGEVTIARIRTFAEDRRRAGFDPATVRLMVRQMSSLYADLVERPAETGATVNPFRGLPRTLRALLRPTHDPRLVPYVESLDAVAGLLGALPLKERTAYALGALAGLRPGEILAQAWPDVDLDARRLVVREQVQRGQLTPLKDKEARILPLSSSLLPILAEYRLSSGGRGLLFPPARPGRISGTARKPARFMRPHGLASALKAAARSTGQRQIETWEKPWYQASRHTFASHYVRGGGSLESLAVLLGHSSTEVTQRYAHLRPDHLTTADVDRVAVDLAPRMGQVVRHPGRRKRKTQ
jgi:integrase